VVCIEPLSMRVGKRIKALIVIAMMAVMII
jgi:hypothetical protein